MIPYRVPTGQTEEGFHMVRILVMADLHGYLENLQQAIALHPDVDFAVIAGDMELENAALSQVCGRLPYYAIRGNNDPASSYPEECVLSFSADPRSGISPIPDVVNLTQEEIIPRSSDTVLRILLTHGHRYILPDFESVVSGSSKIIFGSRTKKSLLSNRAAQLCADAVIFGHTHAFYEDCNGERYFLNPGSLCMTPGFNAFAASYAILECTDSGLRFTQLHLPERQGWF